MCGWDAGTGSTSSGMVSSRSTPRHFNSRTRSAAHSAPPTAGERKETTYGGQLTFGNYVGEGRYVLTESRLAASAVKTNVAPYRQLPGVSVLVRSATLDASSDITGITLGGASFFDTDD